MSLLVVGPLTGNFKYARLNFNIEDRDIALGG